MKIEDDMADGQRDTIEKALKESEERYRDIFENANDLIYMLDLSGNLTYANRACERLLGYSREEVLGTPVARLVLPQYLDTMVEMLERKVGGEVRTSYELGVTTRDGRQLMLEISTTLIYEQGKAVGIQGMARDITERKQAEEERNRLLGLERAARAEAEQASRMKDQFLATVSHELRTPLTAILGSARILRLPGLDEETRRSALEIIERNADSQARLVEDLLDVSRIASGKLRLDLREIDMAEVISAAVAAIGHAADAKGLELEVGLNHAPCSVSGDRERLRQAVSNLLANAIKFTAAGGRIQLRLDRVGDRVEITVSDTGKGMDPLFLPRAFELWSQADSGLTRTHGGLGLGLAIARELIELHRGTIEAHSEGEGKGSTFKISLPAY
jgi:PAS domain S-box-containing protein